MCVSMEARRTSDPGAPVVVNYPMWVLGMELGFSGRVQVFLTTEPAL